MNNNRLHPWELVLGLTLAVVLLSGAASLKTQEALADSMVRLHVLANSDTQEDQTLKLYVRDVILEEATALLQGTNQLGTANETIEQALPELEEIAQQAVAEQGYGYEVTVELETTYFPTRVYEGFTLPAGDYLALRILIGAAAGQNWWCVVFPPLCTVASSDVAVTAMAGGLDESQINLITQENQGYELKFKSVEWWQSIKQQFS